MNTEKLYYKDPYLTSFDATVISSAPTDGGFLVILDRTAFFPEEGGQSADVGYIGDARVRDVYERDGRIYHVTDAEPVLGAVVSCRIEFNERYEKMKCHTAEHILCGIIHSAYGFDNVGFHLGSEEVVFDVSGVMDAQMISWTEAMANRSVAENHEVRAYFPSPSELEDLEYRAKLDIRENVRIVEIGTVDKCACCAPHVRFTGEIGIIKILGFEKHRGGTRIRMTAGLRALADYRARLAEIQKISELLCTPQSEVASGVERLVHENEELRFKIKSAALRSARAAAADLSPTDGNAICYDPDFGMEELRELSKAAAGKVGGMLIALGGNEGDIKYVITSATCDLRAVAKEMNLSLLGRGGGRAEMLQGSFGAPLEKIKEYFK